MEEIAGNVFMTNENSKKMKKKIADANFRSINSIHTSLVHSRWVSVVDIEL